MDVMVSKGGGVQAKWSYKNYPQKSQSRCSVLASRGRFPAAPAKSKEQLDKELDTYMANTKSSLDKEMDEYMNGIHSSTI